MNRQCKQQAHRAPCHPFSFVLALCASCSVSARPNPVTSPSMGRLLATKSPVRDNSARLACAPRIVSRDVSYPVSMHPTHATCARRRRSVAARRRRPQLPAPGFRPSPSPSRRQQSTRTPQCVLFDTLHSFSLEFRRSPSRRHRRNR